MTHPLVRTNGTDVEEHVRALLRLVGEDPDREGLRETPARVVRSLLELTGGYGEDPASILGRVFTEPAEEMVVLAGVEFRSLCEHHLLPFEGRATIAYLPDDRIVGLSKLARLLHCYARRLQVQERLTHEVADALMDHLAPRGVAVLVEAEHACMRLRGVKTPGTMVTSAYTGEMKDPERRREFLEHARNA